MSASIHQIALAEVGARRAAWPREKLDQERTGEFYALYEADGPDALPPLEVVPDPSGGFLLADGWHRASALTALNVAIVPAVILPLEPGHDPAQVAYEHALARSAISSKPLGRAEKQTAVLYLLRAYPGSSDREIGRRVGVDHKTVGRLRARGDSPIDTPRAKAPATPEQTARRLLASFEKLSQAPSSGFADWLRGTDRRGERLASVLVDVYGEQAAERTQQFIGWLADAAGALDQGVQP
jgi:ParB-like chromosome segregation protein Spo0J